MAGYGSGRLYALGITPSDYLDLGGWHDPLPEDNVPYFVNPDQRGLDVVTEFTASPYNKAWTRKGGLVLPTRRIMEYNGSGATTQRNWREWLRYYVRDTNPGFYLYGQAYGRQADNAEYLENHYYRIKILTLPAWLNGSLNSMAEIPPRLKLDYYCDDEGKFDDITTAPDDTNNFTITAVDTGTKKFTIAGDYTAYFTITRVFEVTGSTGNDGSYFCTTNSSLNGGNTEITVAALPDATVDGQIELPNIFSRGARTS